MACAVSFMRSCRASCSGTSRASARIAICRKRPNFLGETLAMLQLIFLIVRIFTFEAIRGHQEKRQWEKEQEEAARYGQEEVRILCPSCGARFRIDYDDLNRK